MILVCKGCSKKMRVSDDTAGKRVRCSACQAINVVPLNELDQLEVIEDEPDFRPAARRHRPEYDQEDHPRERARSGPPPLPNAPRSSSGLLYVLLGILGLLLVGVLGGGIALAIWLTSVVPPRDVPKPPVENPEPPAWKTFSPPDGRFRVLIPEIPSRMALPANPTTPDLRSIKYSTPLEKLPIFGVVEHSLPSNNPALEFETAYQGERDTLLRVSNGKIVKEEEIRLGELRGKEFHIQCEDGSYSITRLFHARGEGRKWIWQLQVAGMDRGQVAFQGQRFLDSLELRDLVLDPTQVVIGPKPDDPRPIDPRPIDPLPPGPRPTPGPGKPGVTFLDPLPEHGWFQAVAEKEYQWRGHQTDHPVWDEVQHTRAMTLAFHPTQNLLASGTIDKRLRLWDWTKPGESQILPTDTGYWVTALAFRPDGKHLAYAAGCRVYVLDLEGKKLHSALEVRNEIGDLEGDIRTLTYTGDGKHLFLGLRRNPHNRSETALVDLAERKVLARRSGVPSEPVKAIFPDKDRLIVIYNKQIQICDATNLQIKHEIKLEKDEEAMTGAAVHPDGSQIAALCVDRQIRLYDAKTGASMKSWSFPRKGFHMIPQHIEFTPDGKYLAMNSDSDLFVYDVTKGVAHREPIDRGQPVHILVFSRSSKVYAMTTYGGPRIFNTKRLEDALSRPAAPREVRPGEGVVPPTPPMPPASGVDPNPAISVRYQPGGTLAALVRRDRSLELWDPAVQHTVAKPTKKGESVLDFSFSVDGQQLVILLSDYTLVNYNVSLRKEISRGTRVLAEEAPQTIALINTNRTSVAAAPHKSDSTKSNLILCDAQTGKRLEGKIELPVRVNVLRTSSTGHLFALADDRILVCDPSTGKVLHPLTLPEGKLIHKFAISTDGKTLTALVDGKRMVVWDTKTGKLKANHKIDQPVGHMIYMKDSPYLLLTGAFSGFDFFNTTDGKIYQNRIIGYPNFLHLDLSPSGDRLLMASNERLHQTETAALLAPLPAAYPQAAVPEGFVGAIKLPEKEKILSVAVSPDQKYLAVGCWDGSLRIYDFQTRKVVTEIKETEGAVSTLVFHPDNKMLAIGTVVGDVVIWDVGGAKLQKKHTMKHPKTGKPGQISVLQYTPKGGGLIVGHHRSGADGEWLLLDPELGKVIHRYDLGKSKPLHIEWLPDGKFLAASERFLHRFDQAKFEMSMNMGFGEQCINCMGLSSDGKEYWVRGSNGQLARYSLELGRRVGNVVEMKSPGANEPQWCNVIPLRGRRQALINGREFQVTLCDFSGPTETMQTLSFGKGFPLVHPAIATSDGKHLIVSLDNEVKIYDVDVLIRGVKP